MIASQVSFSVCHEMPMRDFIDLTLIEFPDIQHCYRKAARYAYATANQIPHAKHAIYVTIKFITPPRLREQARAWVTTNMKIARDYIFRNYFSLDSDILATL